MKQNEYTKFFLSQQKNSCDRIASKRTANVEVIKAKCDQEANALKPSIWNYKKNQQIVSALDKFPKAYKDKSLKFTSQEVDLLLNNPYIKSIELFWPKGFDAAVKERIAAVAAAREAGLSAIR